MNKHTPGPWIVSGPILSSSENAKGFRILAESGSSWRWIADASPVILNERGDASAEGEANARLIAAAPDLLQTLEDARSDIWRYLNGNDVRLEDVIKAIDAVVAKATGSAS